ncbi:MAG: IPExxxVDY family protein [Sphingobacteriaceae bacterium]|nr:MAG: IPExxxVDY family protein [Sphingobacteriaceae bacterium]
MNRKILSFELDLDFILIAITSPLKDYRLCYHINKELHADFKKVDDYELNLFAGNEPMQFSQYFYQIKTSETEFYIIANRGAAGFLIPEMGSVNYFMLIKNHFDHEDLNNMMYRLKRIENIKKIAKVDPRKIKSNENLLF